jgi:Na+/H+ antiporter NhaD/arsenite permease-like protein
MIPVVGLLAAEGVPVDLIWWALVFGVGFGGNASPIGSSVGVIVVAKAEQTDNPISFIQWLKIGIPATALALSVATVALIIFYETGFVNTTPVEAASDTTVLIETATSTEAVNAH